MCGTRLSVVLAYHARYESVNSGALQSSQKRCYGASSKHILRKPEQEDLARVAANNDALSLHQASQPTSVRRAVPWGQGDQLMTKTQKPHKTTTTKKKKNPRKKQQPRRQR